MRKINKIMMATVSVLLSSVLITSSVVSNTFAKYVTSPSRVSSNTATVAAWGVEVTATLDPDYRQYLSENTTTNISAISDNTISVTLPNVIIHPGDDFSDAIHFTISGNPEVAVRLVMQISFGVDTADYYVPVGVGGLKAGEGLVGSSTTQIKMFPMGTTFCVGDDVRYLVEPWITNTNADKRHDGSANLAVFNSSANYRRTMSSVLSGMIDAEYDFEGSGTATKCYLTKTFEPNNDICYTYTAANGQESQINSFSVGLKWPLEYTEHRFYSAEQLNEMEMYICNNADSSNISLSYTITIEQING